MKPTHSRWRSYSLGRKFALKPRTASLGHPYPQEEPDNLLLLQLDHRLRKAEKAENEFMSGQKRQELKC